MHTSIRFQRIAAAALLCLGLMTPSLGRAGQPAVVARLEQPLTAHDVTLSAAGLLQGAIVNPDGVAASRSVIQIRQRGQLIASAVSDENGRFAIQGLRGGLYEVQSDQAARLTRVWTFKSAPPNAQAGVMLVRGATVRGQSLGSAICRRPILTFVGITTTVGVPILLTKLPPNRPAS